MTAGKATKGDPVPVWQARLRHYGGFVLAGALAFATDAVLLEFLTRVLEVPALIARIFAIAVAMVVSWLVNRTVTFQMPGPPRLAEFLRFAAVAWSAQAVNYACFAAILLLWPETEPVLALLLASPLAILVSYVGYRSAVFRQ